MSRGEQVALCTVHVRKVSRSLRFAPNLAGPLFAPESRLLIYKTSLTLSNPFPYVLDLTHLTPVFSTDQTMSALPQGSAPKRLASDPPFRHGHVGR